MIKNKWIFWLLSGLLLFAGCNRTKFKQEQGNGTPKYSSLVTTERDFEYKADFFDQNSSRQSRKVDIIWVIDSSGSMSEEINAINQNLMAFVGALDHYKIDYRLALLLKNYRKFNLKIPKEVKDCDKAGVSKSNICKFSAHVNSYNGLKVLLNCFQIPYNSKYVSMFDNYRYIDKRLLTSLNWSCGDPEELGSGKLAVPFTQFMRDGVHKEIIMVTDDESFVTADGFVSHMTGKLADMTVHSIVAVNPDSAKFVGYSLTENPKSKASDSCRTERVSSVYPKLSNQTEGKVIDICEKNWKNIFEILKFEIVKKTTFTLSHSPIVESITVAVSDKDISNSKWYYDAKTKNIVFTKGYSPPLDSMIKVRYKIPKAKQ